MPTEAAVGQRTPNAQYLGLRLQYDKVPEGSFDPLAIPGRSPSSSGTSSSLQYFVLYFLGGFVSVIVLLFLHLLGLPVGFVATLGVLGRRAHRDRAWLPVLAASGAGPPSEWKFSVDDKAAAAPVAFEHITWAARRRETPLDLIQVRRLNLAGGQGRDYLELRRGHFTGFISCFAYGQDLSWAGRFIFASLRCAIC